MYEYVSDILRAKRIDPRDVILIRHADSKKDKEHHFRKAQEAGYIKEYTAMQESGFSKGRNYLMVFIGEGTTLARFFALYSIGSIFPSRAGHVPAGYPNKSEEAKDGEYMELREEPLPPDLRGFVIDWGSRGLSWHQYGENEKLIVEILS